MHDSDTEGYVMFGHVKWFDPGKGFGFIVASEGGPDILLHANVLRNFGQSSVADGTESHRDPAGRTNACRGSV